MCPETPAPGKTAAKPVIALLGRPNVGKSTLFNALTRTRDALVADMPGLTRDCQTGEGRRGECPFLVIDTGGIDAGAEGLGEQVSRQALAAAEDADALVLVVDARAGLTAADETVAAQLRRLGRPVVVAANKAEGMPGALAAAEFHRLGLDEVHAISAAHGEGLGALVEAALAPLPPAAPDLEQVLPRALRVTVLGRPNVGKSTLVNRMLGDARMLTFDAPGTTRDSIATPFQRAGQDYLLVDTAGVRRRARVQDGVEKLSVVKALQAIDASEVVILVIDARETLTDQDLHLLGMVLQAGRALVVAVNKWDGLPADQRAWVRREVARRLGFVSWARVHYISALHGTGVGELFKSVRRAWQCGRIEVPARRLTGLLEQALSAHQPPLVRGRRSKMRFAHLGGRNPPVIVIHGTTVDSVPGSYRRYLENFFRDALRLEGTPLRIDFERSSNPFAGQRNTLTPRQVAKRRRLMAHVKR